MIRNNRETVAVFCFLHTETNYEFPWKSFALRFALSVLADDIRVIVQVSQRFDVSSLEIPRSFSISTSFSERERERTVPLPR